MSANTPGHGVEKIYSDEHIKTPVHSHGTISDKKGELDLSDSQFTIFDEFLPSLNAYLNPERSITVHSSANVEEQTPVSITRIRQSSRFNESPYTMKFDSAVGKYSNFYFYM